MEFAGKLASFLSLASLMLTGTAWGNDSAAGKSSESVTSVPRAQVTQLAKQIDALVDSKLESMGESRNSRASDEIFLRRAYLDIIGRIPTLDEANKFLNSKDKKSGEKKKSSAE